MLKKKLTVAVFDTQGNRLSYPEIIIGTGFHKIGTENGTLEMPLKTLKLKDLLTVKYLGYKTTQIPLDSVLLSNDLINVNLEEDSYLLDSIVVRPSGFSAEKYFRQKKRTYFFPIIANISFTRNLS